MLNIIGFWIVAAIVIIAFMKGTGGCGGSCNQGRLPCDCKDKK